VFTFTPNNSGAGPIKALKTGHNFILPTETCRPVKKCSWCKLKKKIIFLKLFPEREMPWKPSQMA